MKTSRIAFCGYSRTGKDSAAIPLIEAGHTRRCFGDIIKRQLDPIIQKHFGFSAFTEVTAEKARIRRTLESWGEDNYDAILDELFDGLPERCVNTRLCRVREARRWREVGGILIEVVREGVGPSTPWEEATMREMRAAGLVDGELPNHGTVAELQSLARSCFLGLEQFA